MCSESFNQAIREAHLLYNVPLFNGDFDVNKDVVEGQMVAFDEMVAPKNPKSRVDVHDIEDKEDYDSNNRKF